MPGPAVTASLRSRPPRRRVSEEALRRHPMVVRLTDQEREAVRVAAEASGMTVSTYLRARCLGYQIPRPRGRVDALAFAALSAAGNNLNQLQRALNAGVIPEGAAILRRVSELREAVEAIRRALLATPESPYEAGK